jgi:hypothetical protein
VRDRATTAATRLSSPAVNLAQRLMVSARGPSLSAAEARRSVLLESIWTDALTAVLVEHHATMSRTALARLLSDIAQAHQEPPQRHRGTAWRR